MSDEIRNTAASAFAPTVWGTTYLITSELLPAGRPLTAAVLRSLPAGLVLLVITRRLPRGVWLWRSVVLGALNIGVFLALLFVAAYRLPGGVAATITSMQPLLVTLLAWRLLSERLSARAIVLALAGIAGVALLVLRAQARLDPIGVAAAVGAAISMASGVVLTRRWPAPVSVLALTGWQMFAGGLLVLPVALATEGVPRALGIGNLAGYCYLAIIGGALAYVLWFRGIRKLAPTRVTFLALLSPVVATALGWIVLGQRLTPLQALGALVVLGSVLVSQRPARPAPRSRLMRSDDRADGVGRTPAARHASLHPHRSPSQLRG